MRKSATLMLHGAAAIGLIWLTSSPFAFGQEDKASPQQSDVAPTMEDSSQSVIKKKAKKNGEYKTKDAPAASEAPRPAPAPVIERTGSGGECPENPCTTPATGW